jgi:hypothetical protein
MIKKFVLALAALAVAVLVAHAPGPFSFSHVALVLVGVVALDSLAGAIRGGAFPALCSAGTALGELISDKPFRKHVLDRWVRRGLRLFHESNEEIDHLIARGGGRVPKLHGYNPFAPQGSPNSVQAAGGVQGRLEENYLYSTRRFPNNTANNTIGSGAVTAGDYNFFTSGVGDQGNTMGYFSVSALTYLQTNMAPSGKIPNGRGFKMFDLGVSFNAQASSANIAQMLDTCSISFQKQAAQLKVFNGPILLWPGGVGLSGFAATAVGGSPLTIAGASNGIAQLSNMRRTKNPRILSANDDFQYVVTAAAATPQSNTTVALTDFVEMRVALFGFVLDKIPN